MLRHGVALKENRQLIKDDHLDKNEFFRQATLKICGEQVNIRGRVPKGSGILLTGLPDNQVGFENGCLRFVLLVGQVGFHDAGKGMLHHLFA